MADEDDQPSSTAPRSKGATQKGDKDRQRIIVAGTLLLVLIGYMALRRGGSSGGGGTSATVPPSSPGVPDLGSGGGSTGGQAPVDLSPVTSALTDLGTQVQDLTGLLLSYTPATGGGGTDTTVTPVGMVAGQAAPSAPLGSATHYTKDHPPPGELWWDNHGFIKGSKIPHNATGVHGVYTSQGWRLKPLAPPKPKAPASHG